MTCQLMMRDVNLFLKVFMSSLLILRHGKGRTSWRCHHLHQFLSQLSLLLRSGRSTEPRRSTGPNISKYYYYYENPSIYSFFFIFEIHVYRFNPLNLDYWLNCIVFVFFSSIRPAKYADISIENYVINEWMMFGYEAPCDQRCSASPAASGTAPV